MKKKAKAEEEGHQLDDNDQTSSRGIPDFWLKVLLGHQKTRGKVTKADEEILAYLKDIYIKRSEEPMGFSLHFVFGNNPYFTNPELIKVFRMRLDPSKIEADKFSGAETFESVG